MGWIPKKFFNWRAWRAGKKDGAKARKWSPWTRKSYTKGFKKTFYKGKKGSKNPNKGNKNPRVTNTKKNGYWKKTGLNTSKWIPQKSGTVNKKQAGEQMVFIIPLIIAVVVFIPILRHFLKELYQKEGWLENHNQNYNNFKKKLRK